MCGWMRIRWSGRGETGCFLVRLKGKPTHRKERFRFPLLSSRFVRGAGRNYLPSQFTYSATHAQPAPIAASVRADGSSHRPHRDDASIFSPFPEPPVPSVKGSTSPPLPLSGNDASAGAPAQLAKPRETIVLPTGDNPAFRGLTARPARTLSPQVTTTHVEWNSRVGVVTKEPGRDLLTKLPTELLEAMDLNPQQMQFVNRRFARMYHERGVAMSLADTPPPARSLNGITLALDGLCGTVEPHLRHSPLAVLCSRLEHVSPDERMKAFNLLAKATEECESPLEPLTEMFRQINIGSGRGAREISRTQIWSEPDINVYQARLMSIPGSARAKALADVDTVHHYEDVRPFLAGISRLENVDDQTAVLGTLANQLFHRPDLDTYHFGEIGGNFHHLPWPPAAAAGLLKRGWVEPAAENALQLLAGRTPRDQDN